MLATYLHASQSVASLLFSVEKGCYLSRMSLNFPEVEHNYQEIGHKPPGTFNFLGFHKAD